MPEMSTLWSSIEELFKQNSSSTAYATWIESAKPISLEGNKLTLELPSPLHRDYWTHQHLDQQLVEYAYEATQQDIQPVLILEDERQPQVSRANADQADATETTPTFMKETALNPRYTFDTFVIGKGNQMAHAAALVVSEEPGVMYNPLFFYGGVGLGKTHLMHAIGNKMLEDHPDTKIKYVTSEAFTNDFINAIRTRTQEEFRQEYRNVDLLLVDDIQFFANKEGTQEEFFHTFNTLYDDGKQIVLTSDRLPNEIPKLQDRLVSRFAWGLSVDITPPDLETRIAILRNKADADDIEIPDDTLSYIAGQIDSNVRELEGALARVQAYHQLMHQPITTDLAAEALKGLNLANASDAITIPVIQDRVADYFHVSLKDLKGKKRKKTIVIPRQIAMYLSRELTDASLPRIGNEFGGKDHTTVIHAYDKIAASLKTDTELQKDIADLKEELRR
ncbi:chromosomal replication initiator protein DnaA [Levilactobacillus spicheri]|uniref:Chromosomal replication initiator protein DnaA n=2 Tax=Levilactobacillus spicheri TaxID=216463 RepID=A0A0F3RRK8_9LACO|nr:chromosomal replication initiator protein DnaA [Levilactobacillus spicheri]KJW12631.1 chromosomal replication initiator protein DnaA [Levilactobacillus spicheri]KRL48558.1 chromosomal replication initiation protein [Levilactobacillus spicheri DSM 15429]GEO67758.1 chromosomal replication initiator protein DnaA [Levilactobacillus spicheri]